MSAAARVRLIHTNDLHSNLDLWPHTAAVVRAERARAAAEGIPSLYLDAGDHMDMSDSVTYGTRGSLNMDLLAALGCQAMTVGNNEVLRLKVEELTGLAVRSPFPWLGANMRALGGESLAGLVDWTVIDAGAVRVGVFGLTPFYGNTGVAMGFSQLDAVPTVKRCVAKLQEAGAHLIVFLSHLGVEEDRRLAQMGLGFDLLVGGHSHTLLDPPEMWAGVPVAQGSAYGKSVGVLDLLIDVDARGLRGFTGYVAPVEPSATPVDPEAATLIAVAAEETERAFAEVLVTLLHPLSHDPLGDSALAPLIAEAVRLRAGAEIGLTVGGQAHTGLPAGPVTRAQVMEALLPMFIPAEMELAGCTLKELLEQSEDPGCYGTKLWAAGMRPRGRAIGRIFASGVSFDVDRGAPLGRRIRNLRVGEELVEPDRLYRAGGPSLLGFAESGYPAGSGIRVVRRFMPEFVREVFEVALRDGLVV